MGGILHLAGLILQLERIIQVFTYSPQFGVLEMVSFAVANDTFFVVV